MSTEFNNKVLGKGYDMEILSGITEGGTFCPYVFKYLT